MLWPAAWRSQVSTALLAAKPQIPVFHRASRNLSLAAGTLYAYSMDVVWLNAQWLGVRVTAAQVSFETHWANPVWEIAGWPVDDAFQKVSRRLDDAVTEELAGQGLARALSLLDLGDARWFSATWFQIIWAWFGFC